MVKDLVRAKEDNLDVAMKAIGGPSDLLQSTEGLACRPSCWRIGNPPVTACVHESTGSAPAEAGEPTASRSAPAAAARCRASSHVAPRVAPEAGPPSRLRHLQRNRMPQKRSQPAQKGAQSSLSLPPLSLSCSPRESLKAAARRSSSASPLQWHPRPSSVQPV